MNDYIRAVPDSRNSEFRKERPLESGGGGGNDGDMRERIAKLEALTASLATKADVESIRTDFEKGQKENRAWMLATVIALFLGILTVGNFIASGIKQAPAPATPVTAPAPAPPIVIYPPPPVLPPAPQGQSTP